MTDDIAFAGVARQAEMVRSGEVSSRELTELCLGRIERIDPLLNAYRVTMDERALAEADQADSRRGGGDDRPLLGVPISIKDDADVAGEASRHGSRATSAEPKRADSEVVRRLRAAGAVILGKTNLPELAIIGDTESGEFGTTHNPWALDRSPGGSSGGSGAAVAAGLVPAALGSDGGGSIRIPASCCGLFGLKPQLDRLPLAPARSQWLDLSVFGFLTRSVADQALLLDVTAGPVAGDLKSPSRPDEPFAEAAARPPGRLRIAVSERQMGPGRPPHPEVRRALQETAETLSLLGHEVNRADPPFGDIAANWIPRFLAGIAKEAGETCDRALMDRRTRGFDRMGRALPSALIRRVRVGDERHRRRLAPFFADHDVLLTPVSTQPPVRGGRFEGRSAPAALADMAGIYPYTPPWNATGQPAASVPAGFTPDGLPLAVQLVGREGDEATLLSLSAQLEAERPWSDRRPPL